MPAFSYKISVTGDCSNTDVGKIMIEPFGGTPPYTIEYISPISETYVGIITEETKTGLSASTYVVRINDSSLPVNEEFYVNIPVSSGVCGNVVSVQSTTCNSNNGSVTVSANTFYSSVNFALYDSDDNFISSAITNTSQFEFINLSPNAYYCIITDLGGCTAQTSDIIIEESTSLDFGVYIVSNTSCGGSPTGKIFVTGETGVSPYTYLWSNGANTSYISGVSDGSYSVQVTDSNGCSVTKSATIDQVQPIGFGVATIIQPHPFASDGSITITSTGGTLPFYYSASTGDFLISYNQSWTLTGLPSGDYGFLVTDAAFCSYQTEVSLLAAAGISSVEVIVDNAISSTPTGSITVIVEGGLSPYTYGLIYPNSNVVNVTNNLQTYTFQNLLSGEYSLIVNDSQGSTYSNTFLLLNDEKYSLIIDTTGTTCNQENGYVEVEVQWDACVCCTNNFQVFEVDILSATGNTTDLNGKVWVEYINCEGVSITESYSVPNQYQFCTSGSCYTSTINECFDNDLCCEWRVFNDGVTDDYTYTDCDGNPITISVNGNEYSQTFCAVNPTQVGSFSLEHIGSCSVCDCYDGTTNGIYQYYDCNGIYQEGTDVGVSVCIDINRSYNGITLSGPSSTCDCNRPQVYIWQDGVKTNLPQGYLTSTNINCCTVGPNFPITYNLDNGEQIISNTNLTKVTFSNLTSGSHNIKVTDFSGYLVSEGFVIINEGELDFVLFSESCGDGNDGSISVIISNGEEPFTFQWSDNVPGNPQDIYVTNLSADTYTLTLTDSNGCCSTRITTIECYRNLNPYLYYIMGEDEFTETPVGKCSLLKLLNEGYQELIELFTGCKFRFAEFYTKVSVIPSGYTGQTLFFTSYALDSVPTDQQWVDAIVSELLNIPGVYSVNADLVKNEILVLTQPGSNQLVGQEIRIELIIDYTFECEETT